MAKPTQRTEAHHYKAAKAVTRMRTMAVVVDGWPWQQWEADLSLPDRPRGVRLSEKNSGKLAETARESKARRVENLSLWAHPQRGQSDRSSGSAFSPFSLRWLLPCQWLHALQMRGEPHVPFLAGSSRRQKCSCPRSQCVVQCGCIASSVLPAMVASRSQPSNSST